MTLSDERLLPCPFCGADNAMMLGPTCRPETPYNPADRLFPIVRCGSCCAEVSGDNEDYRGQSAIAAWNRRASPHGEAGATVEPLEWPAGEPRTRMRSRGGLVQYTIARSGEGSYWWGAFGDAWGGQFKTLDEAKTAAQADYEARIRSALTGSSVGVEPSDPFTIIAGIRQFGLAADGSDLRDLEAALASAPPQREGLEEAIRRAEPFITCNSGDGNYSVNFKCRSLKDAQDLHTAVIRALTGKGGE